MAPEATTSTSNSTKTAGSKRRNKKSTATAPAPPESSAPANDQTITPSASANEPDVGVNGEGNPNDSSHMKEIQKNMRNIAKKLTATQKVDSIIAENPNLSLDDLVQTRKINADQKAQALKKPALQSQLAQLEEQLALHKKIEDDFQDRLRADRERLKAEHEKELNDLRSEHATKSVESLKSGVRDKLLVLSRFLRAAAARRQMDEDGSEESKAFEGVLLLLYGGDTAAVDAAEKLIEGEDESVPSTEGTSLEVNYDRVKQLSLEYAPFAVEEAWVNGVAQADQHPDSAIAQSTEPAETDPTIAHAGLTEVDSLATGQAPITVEPAAAESATYDLPAQGGTGDNAANAAATEHWDNTANQTNGTEAMGDSWVSVPRPPEETETPAAPLASNSTQKWADEAPVANAPTSQGAPQPTDGFHEVHHGHSRGGRGRGGFEGDMRGRGRGRGGGHRGGGDRGDRGDRGDHGDRGDRGGERGGYRGNGRRGGPPRGGATGPPRDGA